LQQRKPQKQQLEEPLLEHTPQVSEHLARTFLFFKYYDKSGNDTFAQI